MTDVDYKAAIQAEVLEIKRAEARQAKAKADLDELLLKQKLREEDVYKVADHLAHEHYFVGAVDGPNVNQALTRMAMWHRQDPTCDMNLMIHSGGGSVLAGIALYDQMTAYSLRGGGTHKLTILVNGVAASMAGVLVQAGDVRIIGPRSRLMVHELSAQTGGKIGELEDAVEFYRSLNNDLADVYVQRSEGKCSRETFDTLWTRKDKWLTAKESLEYGFVDRIGINIFE